MDGIWAIICSQPELKKEKKINALLRSVVRLKKRLHTGTDVAGDSGRQNQHTLPASFFSHEDNPRLSCFLHCTARAGAFSLSGKKEWSVRCVSARDLSLVSATAPRPINIFAIPSTSSGDPLLQSSSRNNNKTRPTKRFPSTST
jgi:hypothetical protein